MDENTLRAKIFNWLREKRNLNGGIFTRKELEHGIDVNGKRISLVGPTGIWKPKDFSIPISITTISNSPYNDVFTNDGYIKYSYRGKDPNHRDNIGLRQAYKQNVPLIYFHSIMPGKYTAVFPVFIKADNPVSLNVKAEIHHSFIFEAEDLNSRITEEFFKIEQDEVLRNYTSRLTKYRMHQTKFREIVLSAYNRQCTLCKLKHEELLDAAHIIPDSDKEGNPIINNGLSVCKIHHSAYDKNIIGISPDYEIKVRDDVLIEEDGNMLKYGLQSLNGQKLYLPDKKYNYPDPDKLEIRFNQFRNF